MNLPGYLAANAEWCTAVIRTTGATGDGPAFQPNCWTSDTQQQAIRKPGSHSPNSGPICSDGNGNSPSATPAAFFETYRMITGYPNRASWKADHELELSAILKALPLDQLREARRLIAREIHHREAEGPEQHVISDADRALFRNA